MLSIEYNRRPGPPVRTAGKAAESPASRPGVPLRVMMGVQGVAEQVRTRISSSNTPSDLVETLGGISGNGSRLTKYADYGVELGEPLVKDKWWG